VSGVIRAETIMRLLNCCDMKYNGPFYNDDEGRFEVTFREAEFYDLIQRLSNYEAMENQKLCAGTVNTISFDDLWQNHNT